MKEKPISFNAPMVRAVLANIKKMTRLVILPRPVIDSGFEANYDEPEWVLNWKKYEDGFTPEELAKKCPYGKPGDHLWVRETWAVAINVENQDNWPGRPHIQVGDMPFSKAVVYAADGHFQWCDGDGFLIDKSQWKPSIHMPRWASRITLRITDIRVERLRNISEADAIAEGIVQGSDGYFYTGVPVKTGTETFARYVTARNAFKHLWQSIYGNDPVKSWDANPWVWALSFERVK
jgi:hypothetical protein